MAVYLEYRQADGAHVITSYSIHYTKLYEDDAYPLYEKYLRENPRGAKAPPAYYRLGRIEQRGRSFVSALKYYQLLLSQFPRDSLCGEAGFQMGLCYLELEKFAEAEYRFQSYNFV